MKANLYPSNPVILAVWTIDWPQIQTRIYNHRSRVQVPLICRVCQRHIWKDAESVNKGKKIPQYCTVCFPSGTYTASLYHQNGDEVKTSGVTILWTQAYGHPDGCCRVPILCKCGYKRSVLIGHIKSLKFDGLCLKCTNQEKAKSGQSNPNWKGGKTKSHEYVMVTIPVDHPFACMGHKSQASKTTIRIAEHRLVMAIKLNRVLEKWEHVHHINKIKHDNQPDNLQLVAPDKHCSITSLENEVKNLRKKLQELEQQFTQIQ